MNTYFAEILLPIAVPKAFTYRLPGNVAPYVQTGMRVVVPFGKQKLLTGIILSIHENPPKGYTAKYIDSLLDEMPVVNAHQIELWEWMAEYYMCHRGEILIAALPIGLRLSSESKYLLNPAFDGDLTQFSDREALLLEVMAIREVMNSAEVSDLLEIKTIQPTLKKLLEAGAIIIMEDLKERYTPKIETFVRLSEGCRDEEGLQAAFRLLERATKQLETLMVFLRLTSQDDGFGDLKRNILQREAQTTWSIIKEIEKKGIFEFVEGEVGRFALDNIGHPKALELSKVQQNAYEEIKKGFLKKDVILLQGVTSSGKTEIYIKLIKEALEQDKQVLYMLPEIALTTQMIQRLKLHFGSQVAVYHSRFNQNERVEIWKMVLQNDREKARIILGARSAIFLPFSNLGLIIVDEEHEQSFKQMDPAPRYHARDTAVVLAKIHNTKVLMGSATPAFETIQNAKSGKYGFVEITERYGGMSLPEIKTASLNKKNAPMGYFTKELIEAMGKALKAKEQVILFQNRRGYAPVLVCEVCGWSPECTRCDVTVTYHKSLQRLICHYCGSRYTNPANCPACGSHKLKLAGFGTERIEEELPIHFPKAKIARLDLDSTRSKMAYQQILSDFQDGNIDILIGTQMITKGLDFGKVSLVGILNADLLLKFPEFRSTEKGFQMMTQVAGRAGRRAKRGQVLIQTHDPSQWIIAQVIHGNYEAVYESEMLERHKYSYPPYSRLIQLTFRHREVQMVDFCAAEFVKKLQGFIPGQNLLGPEYPVVARVRNRYNKNVILKIDGKMGLAATKDRLMEISSQFFAEKQFRSVRLIINVDPQ